MNRLHISQKKIVRIISYSKFSAHSAPLFQRLNIMNIYNLYNYFVGLFIYKGLHNLLPESFREMFTRNYNARNSLNLRSVYRKKKICLMSIRSNGPKIWNSFPPIVKCARTLRGFKLNLKKYLEMNCDSL